MKKYDFVIGYDISSPKRLAKVSKYLECYAMRIQKSIFLYPNVSKIELKARIDELTSLIDANHDDVRIYQIDTKHSLSINSAIDLQNPTIIKG